MRDGRGVRGVCREKEMKALQQRHGLNAIFTTTATLVAGFITKNAHTHTGLDSLLHCTRIHTHIYA